MSQTQPLDVQWIADAVSLAYITNNDTTAQKIPPYKSKTAWVEQVPVIDVSARPKQETKNWIEQWKLLQKREALATADVHQGAGEWLKGMREMQEEASLGAQGLVRMKRHAWADVSAIRDAVTAVTQQLETVQANPSYVVELSANIDRVDGLLAAFKQWQAASMADLASQEALLEEEIDAAVFRIEDEMAAQPTVKPQAAPTSRHHLSHEAWGDPGRRNTTGGGSAGRRSSASPGPKGSGCLAPEVVQYEEFVARHGETGAWDKEDHEEFVRILKACAGDYVQAVNVTLERCIGYTKTEVMQHARWHMDFMDLQVRKRMAVAAWRAKKDSQRAKASTQAALFEPSTAHSAQQEHLVSTRAAREAQLEAAAKKEVVTGWRERREAARRAAAEAATARAQAAHMRAEIERQERQHFNKMKLELHKQAKEAMARERARQAAAQQAEARQALRAMSAQQADIVAARSAETFNRQLELKAAKGAAAKEREARQKTILEKVRVEVASDPHRVLRGTSAHMRRVEEQRGQDRQRKDSAFILHPHQSLAVPSWRTGT